MVSLCGDSKELFDCEEGRKENRWKRKKMMKLDKSRMKFFEGRLVGKK